MVKGNNAVSDSKISYVGVRVPSFLTTTNSPLQSSGIIDIDYNNTPLPITSGGTGLTAVGSKGQILSVISSDPEQLGWIEGSGTGTVTSVSLTVPEFLTVSPKTITSSGTFDISLTSVPIPISSGGTGLTELGKPFQILSVTEDGTGFGFISPQITTQSISITSSTPFLSTSLNEDILTINSSTIPISYGGTGLTSLGKPSQVLTVNSEGTGLEYTSSKSAISKLSVTVPEFLTVSPQTITSEGTFDISLSSTPIPITSGGTGLTTLGKPNQVLSINETGENYEFITPTEGTVTSVSISSATPFITTSQTPVTTSGELEINCSTIPVSYGGTGLTDPGLPNQILISNGTSLEWNDLPNLDSYLTSINTMFPLSYSDNTLSISSYTGGGRVVFEKSPILTTPIIGDASATSISLNGTQAGSVKLSSQSGSYNFIFPKTVGTPSQILTSEGPFLPTSWSSTIGSGDLLRTSLIGNKGDILAITSTEPTMELGWVAGSGTGTVTSVSLTVPDFLTVSPDPITSSGSFTISLSGNALPISSGGTGITTLGLPNQFLSVTKDGTGLEYMSLPSTVKSVQLSTSTSFISTSKNTITESGVLTVDCNTIPTSHGGTGLTSIGEPLQFLTVNSEGSGLEYKSVSVGVTEISATVPEFLTITPEKITDSGTFKISLSGSAIPISAGGTGLTELGKPFQVLAIDSTGKNYEFTSPAVGTVTSIGLSSNTSFLSVSENLITNSGILSIDCSTIPVSAGGTGLTKPGTMNQILTSDGSMLQWSDPPSLDQYLTSIIAAPPLLYSENTISIGSFTGSGKICFDISPTITTPSFIDPTTNNIQLIGAQSGTVTLSAAAGTYNLILPTDYGRPFQVLTGQGPYNPLQWISTVGSGNLVCTQNPTFSGQSIFSNGTILCKANVIQSQGITRILSDKILTSSEAFSVLIIESEISTTITMPSVQDLHTYIGDFTVGNRLTTIIQNKSPELLIIASDGMTIVDSRISPASLIQEYTYIMISGEEGLLLVK